MLHKVGSQSNSTEYQDRNTMYLGVYGGLGVAQGSQSNSTEYQDRNTMYLGVYGGLGVAQGR